ncbi:similar to Saccharomyces cerevisiae YPL245W Putative protein of unknown function [Maudiozyma barnettii]|uniref:Schlafen group 3-like DNA/RNA helicase domain-containing protein n=1 Tax=Maudiozyma barnettii TaxID=61262 RepID=A0A8H2ZI11_9SACH|nr:hypothetical protein [Kazachstania barnettii]CAB4255383.1 similar to Saccharomyces cerevisiae YPL245W Putative protein of unknown function [Kazachstania barnettii]CAD1783789.1 similar to Saccharomyces cerevisiae YPL245W Putative protein of unknown function [Kazachstania barnettii]
MRRVSYISIKRITMTLDRTYTTKKEAPKFKRAKKNDVQQIESAAMDKLTNVKLSHEQQKLKDKIIGFTRKQLIRYNAKKTTEHSPGFFAIHGDAGTGKSVVLNSLFNDFERLSTENEDHNDVFVGTKNYLVVNHPEMLKLYIRICKQFKYIKRSSLERPTSLINKLLKDNTLVDIIVVDEAHLLATSKDPFKKFYGDNHMVELLALTKVLIVVYDPKQSLRMGCYWDGKLKNGSDISVIENIVPEARRYHERLEKQFRVAAPPDVLNWIKTISEDAKIPDFPKSMKEDYVETNDKNNNKDSVKYDFKIWNDCGEMYEALKLKNEEFGQCRVLCTYDFPYRLDGKDYFVECGKNFRVRWDRYQPRAALPWSERADSIDEVGSVYTIQGFDLNYAAVILGRSIGYDSVNDCLKIKPELYDDRAGFTKKKNILNPDTVKVQIILNSLNVLLTRGVKGLYIYAYDPILRKRLNKSMLEDESISFDETS